MACAERLFGVFQRLHREKISRALASGWPMSAASSPGTAAARGRRARSYLTRSTNRSESWPDKEILTRDITPGQSRYAPYDEKPLAHRVTNTGAGLFRVFDIELLYKPATGPALPPLAAGLKQHWDEKLARSSTIRLEPNAVLTIPANRCSLLVVGIAGTLLVKPDEARPSPLSPGNYKFFGPHTQLQVSAGAGAAEAVLLELKR
jgi:preprotein translocase subunit Sec61beta